MNDALGKLYNNYLVAINLGIALRDRMADAMRELLNDMKEVYKAQVEGASALTEIIFGVFLLFPIVIVGFSFTFKSSLTQILMPLLISPGLYFLAVSSHPFADYNLKYGRYVGMLGAVPVILLMPNLSLTIKMFLIVTLVTILSYTIYYQITLAKELEKSLPLILKEVAEYMKIGYTVQTSLSRIRLASRRVNKAIDKYARDPDKVNSPSKVFNLGFKLMFITAKSGTSSVALQELGNVMQEITQTKENMRKQLALFDIMTLMTPVLLWMTFGMLGNIGNSNHIDSSVVIGSYSLATALIFSKVSRGTILYFPTMLILNVLLAIIFFVPIKLTI